MSAKDASIFAWAYGMLGLRPGGVIRALTRKGLATIQDATPHDLSNLAWGLARAGAGPLQEEAGGEKDGDMKGKFKGNQEPPSAPLFFFHSKAAVSWRRAHVVLFDVHIIRTYRQLLLRQCGVKATWYLVAITTRERADDFVYFFTFTATAFVLARFKTFRLDSANGVPAKRPVSYGTCSSTSTHLVLFRHFHTAPIRVVLRLLDALLAWFSFPFTLPINATQTPPSHLPLYCLVLYASLAHSPLRNGGFLFFCFGLRRRCR